MGIQARSVNTHIAIAYCEPTSVEFMYILASYPFNLERKKYIYLFPMKPDEKTGFRSKQTVFSGHFEIFWRNQK